MQVHTFDVELANLYDNSLEEGKGSTKLLDLLDRIPTSAITHQGLKSKGTDPRNVLQTVVVVVVVVAAAAALATTTTTTTTTTIIIIS